MSYSSEVLADSPLAWYRMGEPSGTTLVDSSGNGRNGTYNGGVTLGSTGLVTDGDTAAVLNGTTGRADVTYGSWMDTGTTFSFEAWILTSSTGFREISSRGISSGDRAFEFRIDSTTGCLNFIKLSNGTTASVGVTSVRDGVKHHVVVTYDGANIRMYVDGALDKTTAATGILVASSSTKLSIGVQDQSDQFWWNGTLDEVAYYGTALSGARISAHYAAGLEVTVAGEKFVTAATMLDGSPQTAVTVAGEAFVSAVTMLDGSAASGPVTVTGEAFAASTVMLDGTPLTAIRIDGETFASVATMLDGEPRLIVSGEAFGSVAAMLDGFLPGLPLVVDGESFTVDVIARDGSILILAGADTANALRGRERGASASVQVLIPASVATTTTRVDKAIGLPVPTMVNGRPT